VARENIKITDVRVRLFSCDVPLEKWWYGAGVTILTEVFTDKGVVGIGGPSPYGGPEFVKEYTEKHIKPCIVGKNPFDMEIFAPGHQETSRAMAWAGVNVAVGTLWAKSRTSPYTNCSRRTRNPKTRIEHYASCGNTLRFRQTAKALYEEALRYKEDGFKSFKFRLAEKLREEHDHRQVHPFPQGLREAVGPDFGLIQELNMRLNLEQVLELAPVLKELKFLWLEEPVNRWAECVEQPTSRRNSQSDRGVPENTGSGGAGAGFGRRTMTTRFEIPGLDRQQRVRHHPAGLRHHGTERGMYSAQHAHLHGKRCVPHNWHDDLTWMSNIQLVAAVPNRWKLESDSHYNRSAAVCSKNRSW